MSKNGGPYTKPEQEERRKQVYEMHFEKSKSAMQIAEELDVNRHTISDDIRYWYSELASEFDKMEVRDLFARQCERMEQQRTRLVQLMEKQQDVHAILKIERMIFDLDKAITKMIAPILKQDKEEISKEEAVSVAESLILDDQYGKITTYSEREILRDIIQYKNCDISHAQKILDKIKSLGLELYKDEGFVVNATRYDLLRFAESHNILSSEKLQEIYSRIEKRQQEQRQEIAELEQQDVEREAKAMAELTAKYGDKSNAWVWQEYYHELGFIGR